MSGYSNPRDLLLQQLARLLFVERMLFDEVIPSVHDESHDGDLQQLLTRHRGETRTHASRLEDAMRAAGAEPSAARCKPLVAMKEEHESEAGSVKHPVLFDCRVASLENCFPMIPSGKAHNEMLLPEQANDEATAKAFAGGKALV